MKSKIICVISAAAMFASTTLSYAESNFGNDDYTEQNVAEYVENVLGTEGLSENVLEKGNSYTVEGAECNIIIPKEGDSPVVISNNEYEISMFLPNELGDANSQVSANGTVVYEPEDEEFAVAVQALYDEQYGIEFEAVRTLVKIESVEAPREYLFDFKLPKGYRLIMDYNYDEEEMDEYDCGAVFVLNSNDEVVSTIEPAWAKDAKGKNISTYYEVEGNSLIQFVDFDYNTEFPVIADPTSHPNKTSEYFFTKSGIKELRDKYTDLSYSTFYSGIITCAAYYTQPCAGVCSTFVFLNQVYSGFKYSSWNAVYANFKKSYAKVSVVFRWRYGGKNSGYVKDSQSVTYVDKCA